MIFKIIDNLASQEKWTPTRVVENVVLTTKGLQERKHNIEWDYGGKIGNKKSNSDCDDFVNLNRSIIYVMNVLLKVIYVLVSIYGILTVAPENLLRCLMDNLASASRFVPSVCLALQRTGHVIYSCKRGLLLSALTSMTFPIFSNWEIPEYITKTHFPNLFSSLNI